MLPDYIWPQEIKSIISAIIRPCNCLSHQVAQSINFPLLFNYIVNINKKSSLHAGEYEKIQCVTWIAEIGIFQNLNEHLKLNSSLTLNLFKSNQIK